MAGVILAVLYLTVAGAFILAEVICDQGHQADAQRELTGTE